MSATVDGIEYTLSGSNVTVTGATSNRVTTVTIPSTITYLGTTYNVKSIGSNAFENYTNLISVTIRSSVTSIGGNAFYGCYILASVTIPNSVLTIGTSAFNGCFSLASVTIPNSVTTINNSTFQNCSSLASITIPNSVTTIGSSAFSKCSSLASITIPNSVTSIGASAFQECSSLASIVVDSANTAFSSLNNVLFNKAQTTLIQYAVGLSSSTYTIPNSVTTISNDAFNGCSKLASVTIGSGVTTIGDTAFAGCSSLTSIIIPNSVTTIGTTMFYGCSSLESITIPNSVTSIGGGAFNGCRSLASVAIGIGVTTISSNAFNNCSNLTSVTFMGNIPTIASGNFTANTNDTAYYYPSTNNTPALAASILAPIFTNVSAIAQVPSAPTINSVTVSNGQASHDLTAGAENGSPITDYEYSTDGGFNWVSAGTTTSPITVPNLTNGTTYNLSVRAVNAVGAGASVSSGSTLVDVLPDTPTITGVTVSTSQAIIAFTGTNNGSQISGYQYSMNNGSTWTPTILTTSSSIINMTSTTSGSITVTNLTNGSTYNFSVRAVNTMGASTPSNSVSTFVAGVPSAPTIIGVTVSSSQAIIAFTAGANNGSPISGYQYSIDGGSNWVSGGTSSPITVTGLTNGTTYNFSVRAVNTMGASSPSNSVSTFVAGVPSAPTITGVTVSSGQAVIAFTSGANNGSPITGYQYSKDNGSTWTPTILTTSSSIINMTSATSGSITVTNLTNGTTYVFRIIAVNTIGASTPSNSVSKLVRPTLPEAKTQNTSKATYTTYDYQLQELVNSGLYTLIELKQIGYVLSELKAFFTTDTLIRTWLFTGSELKQEGLIESGITFIYLVIVFNGVFSVNRTYALNNTNKEDTYYNVVFEGQYFPKLLTSISI